MDWRLKSATQRVLGTIPGGDELHYRLQTRVTRTLPPSPAHLEEVRASAAWLVERATTHVPVPLADQRWVEFGAGWHLGGAIALASMGVGSQVLYDLNAHARPELVRHAIRHFGLVEGGGSSVTELVAPLGIDYRAPDDVLTSGLDGATVHVVHSTSVLEHVPPESIEGMLRESRRILAPEGVAAFIVDYHDHWARGDRRIDGSHFLRYSDRHWRLWNCELQYQNRLRHGNYLELFERGGMEILEVTAIVDPSLPPSPAVYDRFRGRQDLGIGDGRFVLRPARAERSSGGPAR